MPLDKGMMSPAFDVVTRLDTSVVADVMELESVRPGLLGILVAMFDHNTNALLTGIPPRLDAGDLDSLRYGFHSLKGTSANLGALRLSLMADIAERKCATRADTADLRALAWAMRTEFSSVRIELMTLAGLELGAPC